MNIPTEEEIEERKKQYIRELRDRETWWHNAVNDSERARLAAKEELSRAVSRCESNKRSWDRAKEDLKNVEASLKK